MILSLITREHYMPMRLPDRREGFFSLKDIKGRELFTVEGDGNKWVLHETDLGRLPKCQQADLWSGAMLSVRIGTSMRNAAVFAEEAGQKYAKYARCQTPDNVEYTIGSARDNDFICLNPYISGHHCKLACRNREWSVTDSDSQTGTFVNGKRIGPGTWKLRPGDLVSVLNQKFIVLPGLLAFNAQNLDVKAVKESVHILKVPPLPVEHPLAPEKQTVFFHRQARFTDEISGKDFTVDAPPVVHNSGQTQETPAVLSFGPTLLSGAAMLLSGVDLLSGLGMLANSVLFPKLEQRQNSKQQQEQEGQRRKYYTEYLDKLEKELQELHDKQTEMLRRQTPDPAGEAEKLLADKRSLWSRRPEHRDFLNLRLGLGSIPVLANISFPDKTFETKDDPLQQKLEEFQRKPRLLRDVPIVLELKRFYSIGISGESTLRSSFAAQIIAQLAMHIGYDDMKLCILGPLYGPLAPLKWLPHTWNDEGILHFTAGNREEVDRLIPILDSVLEPRRNKPDSEKGSGLKEFIVLITDANLAQSGVITRLLFDNSYDHVHIITLADHSTQLHSRSDVVIGIKEKQGRMVWQEETKRQTADFIPDHGIDSLMPRLVYMMANTFLDIRAESASMPDILPFLDMFGVRDVRQLNILDRWEHAEPVRTLRTPLGISEDGTLCMLDIHNKGDGVHGLIAGTTGSGKSELIMSYILSMAVNYSPRDVAFVLIDYKGGGMANAFAGLPHTVGVITNLDGSTLQRSLVSIDSENKRRQRLFGRPGGRSC